MNVRLTAIIFGVVLLLTGVLLVVVLVDDPKTPGVDDTLLLNPFIDKEGVKEKDVDTVEIVRTEPTEQKLVFVRVQLPPDEAAVQAAKRANKDPEPRTIWELREPVAATVNSAAVDDVVRALFTRLKPVAFAELTGNKSLHGLDKPTVKVTVKAKEKAFTVNVGLTTIGGNRAVTFVTTSADPDTPLAVDKAAFRGVFRDSAFFGGTGGAPQDGPAWKLARWQADYRVGPLFGGGAAEDPTGRAEALSLAVGGKKLALRRQGRDWVFDQPPGWGRADELGASEPRASNAPFTGVAPLLAAVTSLSLRAPEDYIDKPEPPARYGLADGDPNRLEIEFKAPDVPTTVLYVGKAVDENGKPAVPAQVYAQLKGDAAVLKVATDQADGFRETAKNPAEIRNKDLLPPGDTGAANAIDLTAGGQTVKLRQAQAGGEPAAKWVLYGGPTDPQTARQSEVQGLLSELSRPRIVREVLAAPADDAAFAGPDRRVVTVWYGGKPPAGTDPGKFPAEPAPAGKAVELVFGRVEGDTVLVRRTADGVKTDLKVPATTQVAAARDRLGFVDPGLKSFVTSNAVRLQFNRGAEGFDLRKKDDPAGGWTFAAPEARKDRPADALAVQRMLGGLSVPFPVRVAAEQATTPDDLKKFGLDAPRLTATVGLKDDPDPQRELRFGADTEGGVFAQQTGRPAVVVLPTTTFETLLKTDLRDHTLFRVDQAKVTKVRIRGWLPRDAKEGAAPLTYTFEKKGSAWTPVEGTPADYLVSPGKMASLLGALAAPRADDFVDVAAHPQYGLSPERNPDALEIAVWSGGPDAVQLILGNRLADNPARVYGMANTVPGEVFTFTPPPSMGLLADPKGLSPTSAPR